ncbi:MAG TPA: HAD-IC family P-type ATPase, partial [Prosthecobacter sp.]|nr:HAD-IC family P-type ATPase [Prosthecobacter sp.]
MSHLCTDDPAPAVDTLTRRRLLLLFAATVVMATAALSGWLRPDQPSVRNALALLGALLVTVPIVRGVLTAIRSTGFAATQFYMDQYVLLALAACLATGQYLTGGLVAVILIFGQMLEERTTVGVRMALSKLRQLASLRAHRQTGDGAIEDIEAAALQIGDTIHIRPGETVPADATVLTGHALVDQGRITGESVPVEAAPGSGIFAGTINLNGAITARVTGIGTDTVMGRVQSIIEDAKRSEAPIISLAEDYARYYTPLILLIAASVFFFTQDIDRAIAVLVVSIPCAFVLASPSAMVSAIASASRLGILVKSIRHLETARLVDTVVFDKTGTLTQGHLDLEQILVHGDGLTVDDVIALAAAIEGQSNHPVARAIAQAGEGRTLPAVTAVTEHHGLGLVGTCAGEAVLIGRGSWLARHGVDLAINPAEFARHSLVLLALGGRHIATFL